MLGSLSSDVWVQSSGFDFQEASDIFSHRQIWRHHMVSGAFPRDWTFVVDTQRDSWSYVVGHLFAPLEAGVFTVTVALNSTRNVLSGNAGCLSQWVLTICLECLWLSLSEGVAALDVRDQYNFKILVAVFFFILFSFLTYITHNAPSTVL